MLVLQNNVHCMLAWRIAENIFRHWGAQRNIINYFIHIHINFARQPDPSAKCVIPIFLLFNGSDDKDDDDIEMPWATMSRSPFKKKKTKIFGINMRGTFIKIASESPLRSFKQKSRNCHCTSSHVNQFVSVSLFTPKHISLIYVDRKIPIKNQAASSTS